MQEAEDFLADCEALFELVHDLPASDFARATQFKGWTIDDVVGHLHLFNLAAELALTDRKGFEALMAPVIAGFERGESILVSQWEWLGDRKGRDLLSAWREGFRSVADAFRKVDPKLRVKWIGPEMSARSAITARQMETWAHGQEVFDLLGAERRGHDRIRNIVVLGINTFAWSFANRGLPVPGHRPQLNLAAPSGDRWTWESETVENRISGSAVEFAQVVTQVRNVADTGLDVHGETARRWMSIAQCFAGPPTDPPAPGSRYRQTDQRP